MLTFTPEQKATWRAVLAPKATDDQWAFFVIECERRSLIPGTHVIFSTQTSTEYNKALGRQVEVEKVVLITTITGLRLIAERSKNYDGRGPFAFHYLVDEETHEMRESKIPWGRQPHAVSVEMYRKDWSRALFVVARYEAYVPKGSSPTKWWQANGEEQLAKCCEAAGLRTVAPEECGGLYIAEEFNLPSVTLAEPADAPVTPPAPMVAPAVNQAAAPAPVKTVVPEPATPQRIETTRLPVPTPPPTPVPVPAPPVKPPAGPPRPPAPATPPAPPVTPAAPATPPAPPVTPAAPVPAPPAPVQRQPHVPEPIRETRAELEHVADVIAKDKDPKPATPPMPTAPVHSDDTPPPPAEYQAFMNRVTKILRDKLPQGGLKDGNELLKAYLLKQSGAPAISKITKGNFTRILAALDNASADEAAKMVREGSK